jgi:hypothetical protein
LEDTLLSASPVYKQRLVKRRQRRTGAGNINDIVTNYRNCIAYSE